MAPSYVPRIDVLLMPFFMYGLMGPVGLMVATPLCALSVLYPIPLISRFLEWAFGVLIAIAGPALYGMEALGAVLGGFYLDERLSKSPSWLRFLVFLFLLCVIGWSYMVLGIFGSWRWLSLLVNAFLMGIVVVASLFRQRPVAAAFAMLSSCVFMLLASSDTSILLKIYSVGAAPGISLLSPRVISPRWVLFISMLVAFAPSYPELRTWQPLLTLSIFMAQLIFAHRSY